MFRTFLLSICGLSFVATSFAQPIVADKIIAVIGKKVILQSDINLQFESEKANDPTLTDSFKCTIFYTLIAQQILIEQAARDSIIVSDEEVEEILEQKIRYFINQYGSQERLEAASGKSVYQIKEDYRDFFKDKTTAEQMQATIMRNVKITPSEVEEYFNAIPKDSLAPIPASVEMGNIIINPKINPQIETLTKEKMEGIRKDIVEDGSSFATMASIYSVDGSKDDGGLIRINRKEFDPQFVAAAFRLQPGEISPVIRTKFGYHIIKMEKRMGEEAMVRHILLIPEVTSIDLEQTIKRLDSVRSELISGKISFSEAVGKYSTDDQSKMTGGMMMDNKSRTMMLIDDLPDPGVSTAVSTLKVGEYSQPQIFMDPHKNSKAVRILYLKSRTDPHILNLKDDYSSIQYVALSDKQNKYLHSWLKDHVDGYYIKIDPEYQNCSQIKDFIKSTAGKK